MYSSISTGLEILNHLHAFFTNIFFLVRFLGFSLKKLE